MASVSAARTEWLPFELQPYFNDRHGRTEALCVFQFFHAPKSEQRLDGFEHLVNIANAKCRRRTCYWKPLPSVHFVGAKTSNRDWENCVKGITDFNTRGWLKTNLSLVIEKYSPQFVTRHELIQLIALRDPDLCHVCNALVGDLLNAVEQQHEIPTQELFDQPAPQSAKPNYGDAVRLLVKGKALRDSLPPAVLRTLEAVFRRLDAGEGAEDVINKIAADTKSQPRNLRRHLRRARRALPADVKQNFVTTIKNRKCSVRKIDRKSFNKVKVGSTTISASSTGRGFQRSRQSNRNEPKKNSRSHTATALA